jgi:hypothetical protein
MFHYLSQHPEIFTPAVKEPCFFGDDLRRNWRLSRDTYTGYYVAWKDEKYALDASPHYLHSFSAAEEIHNVCPEARIIILTRDPVEASYSLYREQLYGGRVRGSFADCLRAADKMEMAGIPPKRGILESYLYTRIYDFASNIPRFDRFDHVLVMDLSELKDVDKAMEKVWRFLDLNPVPIDAEIRNKGSKAAKLPGLSFFLTAPPPWLGQALAFIPKSWRIGARAAVQRLNTRKDDIPPMPEEARLMLQERFKASAARDRNSGTE